MRIAFCSVGPPYRGGIADFNYQLYQHLKKDHQLYFANFRRQYPKFLFPGQTEYKPRADRPIFPADRLLDSVNPLSWYTTARRIAAFQPDLTIFRYWNPFFAPVFSFVANRLHQQKTGRTLGIIDNLIPHEQSLVDRVAARRILKEMDIVVALSQGVATEIKAVAPEREVQVLFHPLYELYQPQVDKTVARRNLDIPQDLPVFLFFGYIRPYKGVDVLLKAAAQLRTQGVDFKLWVVGEPYESWEPYQALIDRYELKETVRLVLRFASDTETQNFFAAADALILPYKTATQSGILGIAYQAGLPVIATEVGGLAEYIRPGHTGYLVPPDSPGKLAETMRSFLEARAQVDFTANVKEWRERFTVNRFKEELERIVGA